MRITIRRWDEFQHYDRTRRQAPPWIRVYRRLLDDRDYRVLRGEVRALLVDLWLLASESKDGTVTGDPADLAWRLRLSIEDVTLAIQEIAAVRDTDGSPKWIELTDCEALATCETALAGRQHHAALEQSSTEAEQIRAEAEAEPRVRAEPPPLEVPGGLPENRFAPIRDRLTEEGRTAFDGFVRAATHPDALAGEVRALCDGTRGPYTSAHVSQALNDLLVSGVSRPTARQLRRWTQAAATPDAPIRGAESVDTIMERVLQKQGGGGAATA